MKNDEDPCSDDASAHRRRRPPARRNAAPCSPSWQSARIRSAPSWGWPAAALNTRRASARSTAATPSVTPPNSRPSSSRRSACSRATETAPGTCAACWSSRPKSLKPSVTPQPIPPRPAAAAAVAKARARRVVDGAGSSQTVVLVLLISWASRPVAATWYLQNQVPSSAVATASPGRDRPAAAEPGQPVGAGRRFAEPHRKGRDRCRCAGAGHDVGVRHRPVAHDPRRGPAVAAIATGDGLALTRPSTARSPQPPRSTPRPWRTARSGRWAWSASRAARSTADLSRRRTAVQPLTAPDPGWR